MRKIDLEVHDDFVSPSYLEAIQSACDPSSTPWYFQGSQSLTDYDDALIEDFGFSIGILPPWQPNQFDDTPIATLIKPLIYRIKDMAQADQLLRCRLDMTVLHNNYIHPPHIDIDTPHVACIVYVNDSDGDTVIYDHKTKWAKTYPETNNLPIKERVAPRAGRMVLFDGSYLHTGYSPSEHQTRILINTVLS